MKVCELSFPIISFQWRSMQHAKFLDQSIYKQIKRKNIPSPLPLSHLSPHVGWRQYDIDMAQGTDPSVGRSLNIENNYFSFCMNMLESN